MAQITSIKFILETPVSDRTRKHLLVFNKTGTTDYVELGTNGRVASPVLHVVLEDHGTLRVQRVRVYRQVRTETGELVGKGGDTAPFVVPVTNGERFAIKVDFNRKPDAPFLLRYEMDDAEAEVEVYQ